jgi:predicted AlkP superfamily pyrophosphatase or phosphodiesterase
MNRTMRQAFVRRLTRMRRATTLLCTLLLTATLLTAGASAAPKVILMSLDGATPRLINQYLVGGVLSHDEGVGLLLSRGISARRHITVSPSLTAPGHIAIATGSTAPILSVPNFYGAHGYDPELWSMSAIFYAAGPDVGKRTLPYVHDIDIAPTIAHLLGVPPAPTVQGRVIDLRP